MKRDMDLIREILLAREEDRDLRTSEPPEVIAYNVQLLDDAGLLEAIIKKDHRGAAVGCAIMRLTWAGHDFLDATKDDTIWNKAKERILKPGVSWTFSILVEFLKAEAQRRLGPALGLPPAP